METISNLINGKIMQITGAFFLLLLIAVSFLSLMLTNYKHIHTRMVSQHEVKSGIQMCKWNWEKNAHTHINMTGGTKHRIRSINVISESLT